ncbi:hypothetical protein CO661_25795 [Sinorhizobium fredii]|uniref:MSP domain-containing protein n=1 Tax=Rhizobium fredii TaxID=380 RepID=A0A2A6LRW2_RHIFR|nr:hypothetical protein [Sinorhizobium fredii]PDT45057.1 hypothetical protein CO661_25795 [Sinorhizobium fredii]
MRHRILFAALLALALPNGVDLADDESETLEMGLAGLLSAPNRKELPKLTLSAGAALAAEPMLLTVETDSSQELALESAGFFRATWMNEIVIKGIETRPLGVASLEFDEAGEAEISFVAVVPGSYELKVPDTSGDLQKVAVTIE